MVYSGVGVEVEPALRPRRKVLAGYARRSKIQPHRRTRVQVPPPPPKITEGGIIVVLAIVGVSSFVIGFVVGLVLTFLAEKRKYENLIDELKEIDEINVVILEKILTILEKLVVETGGEI